MSARKHHVYEKIYIWNPSTCTCENGKYSASIIGDSVIIYDETIEATISRRNIAIRNFNSLLTFLIFTIAVLIVVSVYCHFIKHQSKQNQLLTHYIINNRIKKMILIMLFKTEY